MSPVEHELLTHAAALRRLARDLVGSADADDLVQETAMRALRSPPPAPGGLGGFLATILRRLAGTHRREHRRRLRREQAAARPELVPGAEEALAHGETLQRLTAALMALPQPYRDALLQRYLEGLRPAAIARRLDLPVATVKTRLQRGLQKLREQLDGERPDWRGALIGAFGLEQLAAGLTGVLLMGTGTKLLIGGAAALLAAVAFFVWPAQPGTAPSTVTGAAGSTAPIAAAAGTSQHEPIGVSLARRDELPAAPRPKEAGVTIRGRCVDAVTKVPVSGCRVTVRANARDGSKPPTPEPITTGSDGCLLFEFAPLAEANITVECRAEGRLKRNAYLGELPTERVVDLGDIDMTAGARVSGKVVGPAGQPVADSSLVIEGLPVAVRSSSGEKIFTRSQSDGSFVFDDVVPEGTWPLWQARGGWIQVAPRSITVAAGALAVEVTVVSAPTPSISGSVVDQSGKPIAKATVKPVYGRAQRYPIATSQADGSFELFALTTDPQPEQIEVSEALGYELPAPTEAIAWGTRDVRFVLERGVSVEVEVVERVGHHAVEEFAVTAPKERGPIPARQWTAVRYPRGRVTVEGIERGRHIVAIMPKDPMLLPNQVLVDVAQGMQPICIELERMQAQPVIVRDTQGRPVAGAVLEVLHLGTVPMTRIHVRDWRKMWPQVSERRVWEDVWPALYGKAETNADGEATLGIPGNDRELGVRATCRGHVPMTVSRPSPTPGQPWLLTLETAAALHGHLRVAGYPPGSAFLALTADDAADVVTKVELAADGSFRVDELQPGPRVLSFGMDVNGNAWPFDPPLRRVTLGPGANAALDIDASQFDASTVKGRVVVDGQPLADGRVELVMPLSRLGRSGGMRSRALAVDAAGRFTAAGTFPGKWRLRLLLDERGEQMALTHGDEFTVPAGAIVDLEFHFLRRRLSVRVRDLQGAPLAGRRVWAELPTRDRRMAETDAHGMAVFDWMPIGKVVLNEKPDPIGRGAEGKVVEIHATQAETAVELQWK